jgi:hypothetical protein
MRKYGKMFQGLLSVCSLCPVQGFNISALEVE